MRCDGDKRRPKTPPMDPGALHAGPLAPPRHDTGCTQPLLGGPDRPRTILHTPVQGSIPLNETGACLGWVMDWRQRPPLPCLVGVAVGNLRQSADKGVKGQSKQRNRIDTRQGPGIGDAGQMCLDASGCVWPISTDADIQPRRGMEARSRYVPEQPGPSPSLG
jgi:hypothetical protein